jgi:putative methyltransferase (TIGR04325 family)
MGLSIRDFIPPAISQVYRRFFRRFGYFGDYSSWEEAMELSTGYDSERILRKVRDSLLKVKRGEAIYERDSVLFDKVQYSWPLLAGLLWIASQKGNRINLVDFGGSLGSTYYQNRKFLSHLKELRWNIVEQDNFVDCGKRDFDNEHLKFYHELEKCFHEQRPDTVLFSSVIQYLERPYSLLGKVCSLGFEFLLFDRTTFIESGEDRITVQKVPPDIYEASYPAWFFNREKFLDFFSVDYELVVEFDALAGAIPLGNRFGYDKGFIFRKRGAK